MHALMGAGMRAVACWRARARARCVVRHACAHLATGRSRLYASSTRRGITTLALCMCMCRRRGIRGIKEARAPAIHGQEGSVAYGGRHAPVGFWD